MTIGVYSGSYDPIHIGHTMVASYIAQSGLVDCVWLLVSRLNPLKRGVTAPADAASRLRMAEIAVSGCPYLRADGIELSMPEPSYTYDTLRELSRRWPQHQFRLVVGADNIRVFDKWRNHDRILAEYGVIVFARPGYDVEVSELPPGAVLLPDTPECRLSSTFIRGEIAARRDVRYYLPAGVAEYIAREGLYSGGVSLS
ncbi:MAG TPA: nicotinate (nicotinamide) nucleotide adenylyltransferase [Porphyromonadaceae bacterium]|nr:nicotinate (nicotinamide) nucleotide adenylyltransferase [Porphyromonadaceae bacterium]